MIVPDHNVMMIPSLSEDEAHYVCAVLNSDVATTFMNSFIEWFFSTHILEMFKIPKWNSHSTAHRKLANLSKRAHRAANAGRLELVAKLESEINSTIRSLTEFASL